MLTVVMYHYVREINNSRFPKIKGLEYSEFKYQVEYFKKHYNFIKMEELIDHFENNSKIPENSLLLTFDDGYLDHYKFVFPILIKNKIQGSFFPPVNAIRDFKVLDVNKIHFILATCLSLEKLLNDFKLIFENYKRIYNLFEFDHYYKLHAKKNRFDNEKVIFFKRMLQRDLPKELRKIILDSLFSKYMDISEKTFSKELYMNEEQINCMIDNGMHFGIHGLNHNWLNYLDISKQQIEIEENINYLKKYKINSNYLSICYPFGGYNNDTLKLVDNNNIKVGFTTQVGVYDNNNYNKFTLPRMDTNDFPKNSKSAKVLY